MKAIKFNLRVTVSGSNGIALYVPAHIVKVSNLRKRKNEYIPAVLDEDGDIIIYMEDNGNE